MSEERKLILQMVSDGRISPEEAELLLQAIEESERTAQSAAAEGVRGSSPTRDSIRGFSDTIERAVNESLRGLDATLRHLQHGHPDQLRERIEEKIRRSAEKAAEFAARAQERVVRAEERATRHAERAVEQAAKHAERARESLRWYREEPVAGRSVIFKAGICIDKESVYQEETLTLSAEPGDRFELYSRVGDVDIQFYEGSEIQAEIRKTVWGEDLADAKERAEATKAELIRHGTTCVLNVVRPSIVGVGVINVKDTRLDYTIRVPHGTHLQVANKVGKVQVVAGSAIGKWDLETKVGDLDITVAPDASFAYNLDTKTGSASMNAQGAKPITAMTGTVGEGSGTINVYSKTGDISIHN
jgi:exonuclease VII large subunit